MMCVQSGTDWSALSIGQLLFELHDRQGQRSLQQLIGTYFAKLEDAGLFLFSLEPVCYDCWAQFEVAFLNISWSPFGAFGAAR